MNEEILSIDELSFTVRRSERRKSLGLTVDRNGELLINAPADAPAQLLENWARSRLLWVYQKLAIKDAHLPVIAPKRFESGDTFYYLGRSYRLKLVDSLDVAVMCKAGWFLMRKSEQPNAEKALQKWFENVGCDWLRQRTSLLSGRFGLQPSGLEVRELGNRWGSCNAAGKLYFNWKLLQMPSQLIDYVITHELVHLIEPKHGPEFWKRMECLMPDYRIRKERLLNSSKDFLVL